jgi:hypothetical protein
MNKSFPVLSEDRLTELWRAPFCRRIGVLTASPEQLAVSRPQTHVASLANIRSSFRRAVDDGLVKQFEISCR